MDFENIYDLIDKEIKNKFNFNNCTKQHIRKYKRHGSELIKDEIFVYTHEDIITPIIMHFRVSTLKSIEFRSKLGFNRYNITLAKEQSVLIPIMDAFEVENKQTQYNALGYRIDLYLYGYKLAVEVDKKGHRNIDREIKRQKAIQKELVCEFIKINPDKKRFKTF